jgi:hypothetical protein
MYILKSKLIKFFIASFFIVFVTLPFQVEASLSVSPPVIDYSGVPRDSVSGVITLTNTASNRRIRVFTFVNNVSLEEEGGREKFTVLRGPENADSVANWVSVTRQEIMLASGESRDIPFSVAIHKDAKPGKYHAFISFAEGSRRSEAEGNISRDRATLLSIEVKDNSEDILNLESFITEKKFITDSSVEFLVTLTNRGDTTLTPEGEIVIYNKSGKEIGVADFNTEGVSIEPEEENEFRVFWSGGFDWGKHRARLTASYGTGERRYLLNDTIFFSSIPIIPLVISFLVMLLIVIFISLYFHRRYERLHHARATQFKRNSFGHDESDEHTINLRKW